MLLHGNDLAGLLRSRNHQLFVQRFDGVDIDDLCLNAACRQLLGCFQTVCHRKPGSDDGQILSFPQNHTFTQFKFVIRAVVDHRNGQSAEPEINRSLVLICRLHRCLCFYIIGRVDDNHPRDRSHQRDIFVALVAGPVFPYGDSRMGRADLYIQLRVSYGVAHLLKGTSCREHSEGTCEGNLSGGGKPCRHADHIAFRDTAVNMAFRKRLLKYACLGCCRQVRVQHYHVLMFFSQLGQSIAIAFSRCDLLYF